MTVNRRLSTRSYLGVEATFLFFLCFVASIISDLEFSAYEQHNVRRFADNFGYRLVTDLLKIIPYSIYYWGFLKRYVFSRNVMGIILSSISFVLLYHLFDKYVINWAVAHADFVSTYLRERSVRWLQLPTINFTVSYLLISAIFPMLGMAFLVRSLTQDAQLKKITEQQLLAELSYLKAQLHPHFFFNTINNIYALALRQSTATAPMVARLGELMRYILDEAAQKTVSLQQEVEFLLGFTALARMRYPQAVQIHFDVQGVTPACQIEPLLLLPFIENAFKHGLDEETTQGFVRIVLCQTENELVLDVHNSKPVTASEDTREGIGLVNVRKRLDILYPDTYQLIVKDEPTSYQVTLTLTTA